MTEPIESAMVVLVPEAEALMRSVRQTFNLETVQVPAHITVLYPFKPPQEITPSLTADLGQLFGQFRPFRFSLDRLATFPGALYLVPSPSEPFVELTRVVHERFPETPPYRGAFDEIVPHLTLGHVPDERPFERVVAEVEDYLGPQLPLEAVAGEITLFDNSCGEWCVHTKFALGG
jgi:2'-5' RNA ligase